MSQKETEKVSQKDRAPDAAHIRDLRPDAQNARFHSARNIGTLVNALHEVGAARSIVIDEDNRVLAGNGLVEAAGEAGIENVKIVEADGNTIIAVRRTGLTEQQKTRLALYNNRASDLSHFDAAALADLLEDDGDILKGLWRDDELDELLRDLPLHETMEESGNESGSGSGTESGTGDGGDLDRVAPDSETAQPGLFLHFRGLKIPMTETEGEDLDRALSGYRDEVGTFYGFVNRLLNGGKSTHE